MTLAAEAVPPELMPILGWAGSIVATVGVTIWASRIFGKRDKAEDVASDKLDKLLADVAAMSAELKVISERLSGHAAEVVEVKARVEGISQNYGTRLGKVEEAIVEVRTLLRSRKR